MTYKICSKNDNASVKVRRYLSSALLLDYDKVNPDIVICIGGDGTFLRAAKAHPNALFFVVQTGKLGFYANFDSSNLDLLVKIINEKSYVIDDLDLLEVNVKNEVYYAINEMTLISVPRTLALNVYVDNFELETFRGTGICISTPYGSTGYNHSLRGAIVDHSVKCIQITEMAGINSVKYHCLGTPLILDSNRKIRLEAANKYKTLILTIDNDSKTIENFDYLDVKLSKKTIKLAKYQETSFMKRVKRSFITKANKTLTEESC